MNQTHKSLRPRRFAPLDPDKGNDNGAPKLDGIVFDVDGTMCEPQNYMFAEMRAALGIPKSVDILDHIYSLPTAAERDSAMESIRAIERRAMHVQRPQPGLLELLAYLERRGVRKGICTRNFETPVTHLLTTHAPQHVFWPIVTRDFRPPKPSPAGILHIAANWRLPSADALIMVGDSVDDMTAGFAAGAATVLLVNETNAHLVNHPHTDLCISRLDELMTVLEGGFVGRAEGVKKISAREAAVEGTGRAEG